MINPKNYNNYMFLPTIQQIETKGLAWINVTRVGPDEMKYLEETFKFHPLHLADCLSPIQRPKLDVRPAYLFMVLLFPVYRRKTREIIPAEVDFFIGPNFLVTVHNNELSPLINFFNLCQISQSQQKKYFTDNPSLLLYEILSRLCNYCQPILDSLQLSTASIEEHIFKGYERRMVREILIIKRSIANFRRIMQVHQAILGKLLNKGEKFFPWNHLKAHFAEIIETTGDIWDTLENLFQTIDALEKTNNALISFRLNDVIKILTTISVTILPITLIASIFGMNLQYMPFTAQPAAFWIIIGMMIVTFSGLIWYFKKRQWL